MSRKQWCCLTVLLAVVVGLLCGPAAARGTALARDAAPVAPAATASAVQGDAARATTSAATTSAVGAFGTGERAARAEAADRAPGVPGCGERRDHDSSPAVPSRARTAYDQAPGLAPWGLPAATGALPAEPPPGIRVPTPVPATPTPIELSVLRV